MQRMKRFLGLPKQERWMLVHALAALLVVRVALPFFSLATVDRLAAGMIWRRSQIPSAYRIAWAIRSLARFVPRATCLVQALAGHALLIRYGYVPRLTIGVTKDDRKCLGAHAWVTCANEVVIGGHDMENYIALLSL